MCTTADANGTRSVTTENRPKRRNKHQLPEWLQPACWSHLCICVWPTLRHHCPSREFCMVLHQRSHNCCALLLQLLSSFTMFRALQPTLRRAYSIQPRKKPRYSDLLATPVVKSILLTLLFGSMVVETTRNRKEIEALRAAYEAKFRILQDITAKIRAKQPVDVAHELKIANAITRNKYNSVTDVELDELFEAFLKMAEEIEEEKVEVETKAPEGVSSEEREKRNKEFL